MNALENQVLDYIRNSRCKYRTMSDLIGRFGVPIIETGVVRKLVSLGLIHYRYEYLHGNRLIFFIVDEDPIVSDKDKSLIKTKKHLPNKEFRESMRDLAIRLLREGCSISEVKSATGFSRTYIYRLQRRINESKKEIGPNTEVQLQQNS